MTRRRKTGAAAMEDGRCHRHAAVVTGRVPRCQRARPETGGDGSVWSSPEGEQGSCRGSETCHPEARAHRVCSANTVQVHVRVVARGAADCAETDGILRPLRDVPRIPGRPRPPNSRPHAAGASRADSSRLTASHCSADTCRLSLTGNSPSV